MITGALQGLSLSRSAGPAGADPRNAFLHERKRKQAIADWDLSHPSEKICWYSEYIGRYAPLSTVWQDSMSCEVRGVAPLKGSDKMVSCYEDGSIAIFDISFPTQGSTGRRKLTELGRSKTAELFRCSMDKNVSSISIGNNSFSGVIESINVDSRRNRAYVAVAEILNEVDLSNLEVVSQQRYAWPITSLSQETCIDHPLTVGTSWSLNLYDPRVPMKDRSRSPEDLLRHKPARPEDSIAFLPNEVKVSQTSSSLNDPIRSKIEQSWRASRPLSRTTLETYAKIEPGPLSILNHKDHEILIAGRFPSILSYDRRYFPRVAYDIYTGARLSCLTTIPFPPKQSSSSLFHSILVAAGEYSGRGSLELYALPHGPSQLSPSQNPTESSLSSGTAYSHRNRQSSSSSKLLSVATQGSRIVFSDAEGGLKWVERDGRGIARRWNINSFEITDRGARISSEHVARKIVALEPSPNGDHGTRSDDDLLIWTGEKLGIVTTKPERFDHEQLVREIEEDKGVDGISAHERDIKRSEEEQQYARRMREALEMQANQRIILSRFRARRGWN